MISYYFSDGKIYVTAYSCFDAAAVPSYDVDVSLTDGTYVISGILQVDITAVTNLAPTFDNLDNTTSTAEDTATGSVIFTVFGSDSHPCHVVTFTLITTGVPFSVNATSKLMLII